MIIPLVEDPRSHRPARIPERAERERPALLVRAQISARKFLSGLLCLLSLIASLACAEPQLRPVDEAANQPEFFTFRARLQAAIARRDVQAVLAVVHKDIRNSFGGGGGIEEFKNKWRLTVPDSPLWTELGTVLALGGTFDGKDRFTAPYIFSRWPGNADSFEHVAIVGADVRVRSEPRAEGAVLASLNFAVVRLADVSKHPRASGWTAISVGDGLTGYVASQFARSSIEYRAIFERKNDRWLLAAFIAGD
jgi:hypothetical protein